MQTLNLTNSSKHSCSLDPDLHLQPLPLLPEQGEDMHLFFEGLPYEGKMISDSILKELDSIAVSLWFLTLEACYLTSVSSSVIWN